MNQECLDIPIQGASVGSLSAIFNREPSTPPEAPAVLLAHGAGAPMDSEFVEKMAVGLAGSGHPVLRFTYPYMERARREQRRFPPDRAPQLEAAHRTALEFIRELLPEAPIILAGKSMGARMASHLAADGVECQGLIFLGYPLHPQGKPEKLRTEHFPRVQSPALILQGTRDALCDLSLLEQSLGQFSGDWKLVVIEGGDHSFDVLKRSGISPSQVHERLIQEMNTWINDLQHPGIQP